jgi:hypothetical protein
VAGDRCQVKRGGRVVGVPARQPLEGEQVPAVAVQPPQDTGRARREMRVHRLLQVVHGRPVRAPPVFALVLGDRLGIRSTLALPLHEDRVP